MLLAGVAAIASEPALAGNYGGGFIEFVMTGGQQAAPQRDPFAQPRAAAPVSAAAMQSAPILYAAPPAHRAPVRVASYGAAPLEARRSVAAEYLRAEVDYKTSERPGTIVVDTRDKHLYLVQEGGRAIRYGIGVGRPGFTWAGVKTITRKAEWPGWTPPPEMIKRRPDLPKHMEGGPENPLGARALYLGSSLYRIHGTNEPYTIGQNVSSGCIRMMNHDVEDLYDRVRVGTKVIVL
ncbi:MAG: L,D-transpeptidase [Rhodoblastus sp.]|nr:L,D-transpeptidase [Rhodoblastus sp.]MCB9999882.1 L,D-transpeptidase [Methylobacteriaceae bacterium]MCC0001577.1 L,D-transpeptidase [Methylobacteriaceae bacterium]